MSYRKRIPRHLVIDESRGVNWGANWGANWGVRAFKYMFYITCVAGLMFVLALFGSAYAVGRLAL